MGLGQRPSQNWLGPARAGSGQVPARLGPKILAKYQLGSARAKNSGSLAQQAKKQVFLIKNVIFLSQFLNLNEIVTILNSYEGIFGIDKKFSSYFFKFMKNFP